VNLDLYNYLLPQIQAVAAGDETNTYFEIPDEVFSYTFTFAELGLAESERDGDAINAAIDAKLEELGYDPSAIINALLFGCPYDMYWMDKTVGIEHGTSTGIAGSGGKFSAIVSGLYFAFPVAGEYKGTKDYTVNSQFGQAVTAAVTNAKAIITANASADDYNKLSAYADAICEMVEYNDEAAYGNFAYEYGNPWQMIWVFDGDDETTVVCEGYSKAFQYLCDNTDFDDDSIYALSVGGNVIFSGSNSGPHMWNIVHMDDGKNYVVDVTAIDTGDSDSFLKGATTTSASGCVLTNGHKYTYSADVKEYFEDDEIIIATEDYEYTGAPVTYKVQLGNNLKGCDPELSATKAEEGDKITVTVNPVEGYEFDYIEVNGTKITKAEFVMPAEYVVVNVVCKKIDYAITCADAENGTVKTNTNTANVGDEITVTATPADGYVLDSITVKDADGNVIELNADNEFRMPMSDVTVSATFKEKPVVKGWVQDGDIWYYIQDDGTKATGWLKVGAWYYFDENGVMLTGWQKIDGVWYCLRNSGSMYAATWLKWGNSWYYLRNNGSMATGWEKVNGTWYLFNSDGVMLTGWQKDNGTWYYLESSGAMKTGWLKSGKDWYYLQSNGAMKTGWLNYNNIWYYMDKTSGAMVTGWKTIDGYKYYFLEDGAMVTGTVRIDGKRYTFDDKGHCLNP
jgi:glucan-binding YG repeat protein